MPARSRPPSAEALERRALLSADLSANFTSVLTAGAGGNDYGREVATDDAGNLYVAGEFSGTVDFDPSAAATQLSAGGGSDLFVAKYTSGGALAWAQRVGGGRGERVGGLALDPFGGGVVLTGWFGGTVDFDPGAAAQPRTSAGGTDAFVVKLDPDAGDFRWAVTAGAGGDDRGGGVAINEDGLVFVTGNFRGTVDFDPRPGSATNLTAAGGPDAFLWRLTGNGAFVGAGRLGGAGATLGRDVAVMPSPDADGAVFVAGEFRGTTDFDPGPAQANRSATRDTDLFVVKLDRLGRFQWVRSAESQSGGGEGSLLNRIAADPSGNVVAVGQLRRRMDFDPGAAAAVLDPGPSSSAAFAWKLDAAGSLAWATRFAGARGEPFGSASAFGVSVDAAGDVYAAGGFRGTVDFGGGTALAGGRSPGGRFLQNAFVAKLGAAGGELAFAERFGSTNNSSADAIAASVAVRGTAVHTAGFFTRTVDFDPGDDSRTKTSAGNNDLFLSTLSQPAESPVAFALGLGADRTDDGTGVAADAEGNTYVAGTFFGTVDFDPGPGVFELSSAGPELRETDVYVAKYTPAGALAWAHRVGNASLDSANDLALDPADGAVYVTGSFVGTVDYDPGAGESNLTSAGLRDAYLLKLDSDGGFVYARGFEGAGSDFGSGVGAGLGDSGDGSVYLTGDFTDTADFDPGPGAAELTGAGAEDAFAVKLDVAGAFVWARRFGGDGSDFGQDVAAGGDGANGDVAVVGAFDSAEADFDPGPGEAVLENPGFSAAFVTRLDAAGGFLWATGFTADDTVDASGVAIDTFGDVHVCGFFIGSADFDGSLADSAGEDDAFLARLDAADGTVANLLRRGGEGSESARRLALDDEDNVYLAGVFSDTVDFDEGGTGDPSAVLTATGFLDAFVLKVTREGDFAAVAGFGGAEFAFAAGVAVGGGAVSVTGTFSQTVDFDPSAGLLELTSEGDEDAFVVRLTLD